MPTALASTGLKHVHGAVYICGDAMRLGIQVRGQIAPLADLGDHAFTGYSGALYATCKIQSDREKATGTVSPVCTVVTLLDSALHVTCKTQSDREQASGCAILCVELLLLTTGNPNLLRVG